MNLLLVKTQDHKISHCFAEDTGFISTRMDFHGSPGK